MPSEKSARLSLRKHIANRRHSSKARTLVAKATGLVTAGNSDSIDSVVMAATVALDKASQKGSIHPNNAARRKSRLMRKRNMVSTNPH